MKVLVFATLLAAIFCTASIPPQQVQISTGDVYGKAPISTLLTKGISPNVYVPQYIVKPNQFSPDMGYGIGYDWAHYYDISVCPPQRGITKKFESLQMEVNELKKELFGSATHDMKILRKNPPQMKGILSTAEQKVLYILSLEELMTFYCKNHSVLRKNKKALK